MYGKIISNMSERGVTILEEYLATNPGLHKDEVKAVNDGIEAMRPKEPKMALEEGAVLINTEIGAAMSDDVLVRELSLGLDSARDRVVGGRLVEYHSPHKEVVDAYHTFVKSLPTNVRGFAIRAINAASRGSILTVGEIRDGQPESLYRDRLGSGGIAFLKVAFARPVPPDARG